MILGGLQFPELQQIKAYFEILLDIANKIITFIELNNYIS